MGKTIMGAAVCPDGFIVDESDELGPLFDSLGSGDVSWSWRAATTRAAAPEPQPTS